MPSQDAIYRFGPFELQTRTRELYKHGTRLKLRPQPLRVLQALVERSGDVVTREELRQLLWSAETFVDFEHGLNTAIKELRGLLNDSASEPRYIETLPKLGYRLLVPVLPVVSDSLIPSKEVVASKENIDAEGLPPQADPRRAKKLEGTIRPLLALRWRFGLVAMVVVLVAGLVAYVEWSRSRARPQAASVRVMLAVLPFENLTGDASQEYFSDGLTEEMISDLGRLDPQRLGVIARTSVMHYKRTPLQLPQIGRELSVQYVLEGSVRRDLDKVRISAQLIQMKDQTHLWSRQYDRELNNLLALQGEVAQEIADEIQLTLGGGHTRITSDRKPPSSPNSYEVYDLYLKGRYYWNKRTPEGFQQAAKYFQQAIVKDSNYAPAYAGLADTFGLMSVWSQVPQNEFMPKARAAAVRALQVDESLAEAHASLALVAENYDYDWQTAENEFRRAIGLDPGYATGHQWYAEYLSWQGRFEEALAESERARQLDPLSLIIATDHGAILYFSRQYERAIAQCRAVLDMDPGFPRTEGILLSSYAQEGRFAEALAELENFHDFYGDGVWYWSFLAYLHGRAGQHAQAQRALEKLEQLAGHSQPPPGSILPLVEAYVGAGRKEEAIALLQKAYAEHSNAVVILKVEPNYDSLHSDPRFQDLLRRVGLAGASATPKP